MSRLALTFACWDYDRIKALLTGAVRPEGIDLNILPLTVEETFFRQLRHREFDVCELSLSSYVLTLNEPDPPFIAIPVFPSRYFRHQSIYVNTESGIRRPEDLIGKRVGTPEYQMTAGVWQRGMLSDDHGVKVTDVEYRTGALNPGVGRREEKIPLDLPPEISVTPIADGENLSDLLAAGELDAIYTAPPPASFGTVPHVRRLFEDFVEVEKDYFRRTGIFPIMHVVALKRELVAAHPWVARSLMKAFDAALEVAVDDLRQGAALKVMLPWLHQHVQETVDALGDQWWPYGIEPNRTVLETFLRYSHEQGLASTLRAPEELFAAGTAESFRV